MISVAPGNIYYKPKGVPVSELEETVVTLDEFEAIRLADYEQWYQEKAAAGMHISRQTFGRIIESARYKIASALINGHAIRIAGGDVALQQDRKILCPRCKNRLANSKNGPSQCPHCKR